MNKVVDEMVSEKTEGKNAKQLNQVIAGFGFSKDVADTYKAKAFKNLDSLMMLNHGLMMRWVNS